MSGLIGKKIGMTSIFDETGKNIPCTILELGPCTVTQIKSNEKDGYKSFITDLESPSFTQYSESKVLFRSVGISFKYTFGKLNFKSRSTNSKIKNDDLQKMESQTE